MGGNCPDRLAAMHRRLDTVVIAGYGRSASLSADESLARLLA